MSGRKDLQVSKGQSPLLALKTDIHAVSRLKSVPILVVLRSKTQNILQKEKVSVSEVRFRGDALSLAERSA